MSTDLFHGELVRLCDEDSQVMAEAYTRWNCDSEYFRLLDTDPPRLWSAKKTKEWLEIDAVEPFPRDLSFGIRTLSEDKLIGFIAFDGINWTNRDTFVAIGIGERDFWSKGYGSDAMRVMLRYGFAELNLHRVSLTVFEFNPRGIRSYEKCGFKHEGSVKEFVLRNGKRWDMLNMSILHSEWAELEQKQK